MELNDLRKDELRNIIKDTFHGQMDDYSNEEIAEMTATMVDKYPSTDMIRRIIELAMELSSDKELHSLEKMVVRLLFLTNVISLTISRKTLPRKKLLPLRL